MSERFSSGSTADVYRTTAKQQIAFPGAEIVRIQKKNYGSGLFRPLWHYRSLEFARLLRPTNFIEPVGFQLTYDPLEFRIFSKEAPVPTDHAMYASHCTVYGGTSKESTCVCPICRRHQTFHKDNNLSNKALELADELKPYGILLPKKDPSDYCLDEAGNLVYFEVEDINILPAIRTLERRLDQLHASEIEALAMLKQWFELTFTSTDVTEETLRAEFMMSI